jgi:anaerobic ribonucleoside-triphosphate reductase
MLNPKIIVKISSTAFSDEASRAILLKAHELAAKSGLVYFANLAVEDRENVSFSGSGVRLSGELTGDWETDTIRTGCLGCVAINLPRITLECNKDKATFMELLRERFEFSARALGIKSNALRQYGKNSLPFLLQKTDGDTYFRLENCSRIVNLVGFREAVEAFMEKNMSEEESCRFAEEIIANLLAFKQKMGRKYGKRLYPAILGNREASERLAHLDIERYGVAKAKFSGTREKPYYSTIKRIALKAAEPLAPPPSLLRMAQASEGLNAGGSLDVFELEDAEFKPEALLEFTRQLVEASATEFFTYNRIISYCASCRQNHHGTLHKCPTCGSMSTLTTFDRFTST